MNPKRALLTLIFLLALAAPAQAGLSSWTLSQGLTQHTRAFAPHNGSIYAGTEADGVFVSANGGISFSALSDGLTAPGAMSIRSLDSIGGTLYAGTSAGLFRLSGSTWQPVGQAPDTAVGQRLDKAPQDLEVVGTTILAGVASGGVYRSSDGGATWIKPAYGNGMSSSESVWGLTAHPTTANLVLAATSSGMYRSTDGGVTWTPRTDGIPWDATTLRVVVHMTTPTVYYASTGIGVYRSLNAGETWAPINSGLSNPPVYAVFLQSANRMYAAGNGGVYWSDVINAADPASARWLPITNAGATNTVFWALSDGFFAGANTLLGGTRGGTHHLTLEPTVNSGAPGLTGTAQVGKTLTASTGTWTGTPGRRFTYLWFICPGGTSCSPMEDETDDQYVIRAGDAGDKVKVRVTARGPFPGPPVSEDSALSATITANPDSLPGQIQNSAPSITSPSLPQPGDTLTASTGTQNTAPTSRQYQWLRCDEAGNNCDPARSPSNSNEYLLTESDVDHRIRVFVIGTNAAGSTRTPDSGPTNLVFPPTPLNAALPAVLGEPHPGETLFGAVGTWASPRTTFARRWVRCNAEGGSCEYIGTESGPTYTVTPSDLGYTIRVWVTGDTNGPSTFPAPVTAESPPSKLIVERPPDPTTDPGGGGGGGGTPPGGGGGGTPGGGTVTDTTIPVITLFKATKSVARGRAVVLVIMLSERATGTITVHRVLKGKKRGKKCVKPTRKLRKAKKCKRYKRVGRPRVLSLRAGTSNIDIPTTKKTRPGRYRVTLVVKDAAGNVSLKKRSFYRVTRR